MENKKKKILKKSYKPLFDQFSSVNVTLICLSFLFHIKDCVIFYVNVIPIFNEKNDTVSTEISQETNFFTIFRVNDIIEK